MPGTISTTPFNIVSPNQPRPPDVQPMPGENVTPITTPGGGTTTPGTTTPATGITPDQQSARGVLNTELANFGLSSLSDTVWNWFLEGRSIDQIMLDIRGTPEYKARFPAMDTLAKRGQAITEQQYVDYETQSIKTLRAAGIDPSFFDVTEGLVNNVSQTELQARADLAKQAVYMGDPATVQQLQALYGVSTGDLAGYWLNPDKALPLIQKQFQAAQESGSAVRTGYGALNQTQAEQLAELGVTQAQADTGFGTLTRERQLFTALPGEGGFGGITQEQQLGATFGGNAVSQAAIEAERQKRLAEFKAGGSFAAGTSSSGQGNVGV